IVGAPKCGTSAMSEYLRQHPNVFICQPKEPSYFCDDLNISVLNSEKEYLELFRNASNQQSMIGDASTNYLISRSAIKNLSKFDKEARIVVMLRDPTEMVYA